MAGGRNAFRELIAFRLLGPPAKADKQITLSVRELANPEHTPHVGSFVGPAWGEHELPLLWKSGSKAIPDHALV